MVRVVRPMFDQVAPPTAPVPLSPTDVAPGAFGAGLAAGGMHFGRTALDIAYKEKLNVDQLAVTQAAAQSEQWLTDNLYGEHGLARMEGQAAMARGATFMEDYRKAQAGIRGGLKGRQLEMYEKGYGIDAQVRVDREVQRKISAARMAYDDDTTKAVTAKFDDAGATAAANGAVGVVRNKDGSLTLDDQTTQDILDKKVAARVLWYQRNGDRVQGDVKIEAQREIRKDISDYHVGVMNSILPLANGSSIVAEYMKKHANEIDPADRAQIEHALNKNLAVDEADALAREAFDTIYMKSEPNDLEADRYQRAYDSVRDNKDAREALSKLRDEYMQTQKEREGQVADQLFNMIDAGEDDATVRRRLNVADLSEDAESAVEQALADRIPGADPDQQWQRFRDLQDMATSDDPKEAEKFRNLNINLERKRLDKSQFQRIKAIYDDVNKGGAGGALNTARSRNQALTSYGDKLYPNRKGFYATPEDMEAADDFEREMDHLIDQKTHEVGHELSPKEIDDLIGPLFSAITFDSFFGRTPGRLADIPGLSEARDIPKWALLDAYADLIEESPDKVPEAGDLIVRARQSMEIDRGRK